VSSAVAVYRWAYGVLAGDAELASIVRGVYADLGPEGAELPLLVIGLSGASSVWVIGREIAEQVAFYAQVVEADGMDAIEAALGRVDELFQAAPAVVDGVRVEAVQRERETFHVEYEGGVLYRYGTAFYRALVTRGG
jgi:hypothetical protein